MAYDKGPPVPSFWRIESSTCRCLPVRARVILEETSGEAQLTVDWKDAEPPARLRIRTDQLGPGKATFEFTTKDGETHRMVAVTHSDQAGGRRYLFGFLVSTDGRQETGTGAWVARDEDPDDRPGPHRDQW